MALFFINVGQQYFRETIKKPNEYVMYGTENGKRNDEIWDSNLRIEKQREESREERSLAVHMERIQQELLNIVSRTLVGDGPC